MDIKVVCGVGKGNTALSAFDAALKDAGVYNYNLICLSSIIPPNTKVEKTENFKASKDEYGHKLYVVMAEIRSDEVGTYIAAGLGWYQTHKDRRGVFVEHTIKGETKIAVNSELDQRIKKSLEDLCEFRGIKCNPEKVRVAISLTKIEAHHASALAIAIYKAESWEDNKPLEIL